MITLRKVKGDLIKMADQGHFNAIGHGCNCFHTMGSGIAPLVNDFTQGRALISDMKTTYGKEEKLGFVSYTFAIATKSYSLSKSLRVYNMYTQFGFGTGEKHINWLAFKSALTQAIMLESRYTNVEINLGIPMIGCGLAGGSERELVDSINQVLEFFVYFNEINGYVTLVEFEK